MLTHGHIFAIIITMEDSFYEGESGIALADDVQVPPDYKVILLNDDYTTKDFVVHILKQVFNKTAAQAKQIMEDVHRKGSGVAGIYTYDIAASRAQMTINLARKEGFPLRCEIESC